MIVMHIKPFGVYCEGQLIVENVELYIKPKDKLLITGKSGIGKTILAKQLRDKLLQDDPQQKVLYIPQQATAYFNPLLTIRAHFEDIRKQQGQSKAVFYGKISEYLNYLGLEQTVLKRYPCECSGGMLQRLLIIYMQCQSPTILIADEPTAALDTTYLQAVLAIWQQACNDGMAIVIVSHQVEQYKAYCDQAFKIEQRKWQCFAWEAVKPLAVTKRKGFTICSVEGIVFREHGFWRKRRTKVLNVEPFYIQQGEIIGIHGASGSGKTTFLQLLMGKLAMQGQMNVPSWQYVPQNYSDSMKASWAVRDIIREAQKAAKASKEDCIRLLQKLQLEPAILLQKIHTLSGGQLQRLALFRVLLKKPKLLLLDEVFASLDAETTQAITKLLLALADQGLAIICVSHDESWLSYYADRQYIIQNEILKEQQHEKTTFTATTQQLAYGM